jgi:hypothetical protein
MRYVAAVLEAGKSHGSESMTDILVLQYDYSTAILSDGERLLNKSDKKNDKLLASNAFTCTARCRTNP